MFTLTDHMTAIVADDKIDIYKLFSLKSSDSILISKPIKNGETFPSYKYIYMLDKIPFRLFEM